MALQKLKEQINKFEKQFQEKMDKQIQQMTLKMDTEIANLKKQFQETIDNLTLQLKAENTQLKTRIEVLEARITKLEDEQKTLGADFLKREK